VLGSLAQYYRIEIVRATRDRLLIVATGEGRPRAVIGTALVGDRVAIDQNFTVRTNFPVPMPPRDYLHTLARVVMNRIFASGFRVPDRSDLDEWEGIYRGNFKYEVRTVSQGGRTLVAIGTGPTVKDDVVEMQPGANLFEWVYQHRQGTWISREIYGALEKIYLAQRIHHAHTGEYAATFDDVVPAWQDLAVLSDTSSPLVLQEFQVDPSFGFQAELAPRSRAPAGEATPTLTRAWSINGTGQVSEVATIERIMSDFERARRKVANHGEVWASPGTPGQGNAPEAPTADADADAGGRKPLLIDAVDGEK
jgi:hypothetical protein